MKQPSEKTKMIAVALLAGVLPSLVILAAYVARKAWKWARHKART